MFPERTLGTANFVNPYGLSNKGLNKKDIDNLLQCAWDNEFRGIDTAADYLNVQETLSNAKNFHRNDWKLTTKIPKRKKGETLNNYEKEIKKFIEHTRKKLNKDVIDTVLVHDPYTLKNDDEMDLVCNVLIDEREKAHLNFLGFSIYEEIIKEKMHFFRALLGNFTLQCPYSIFDRRFEKSITEYSEITSFQIRSIFLQGLLLNQKTFEKKFHETDSYKNFKLWLYENNLSSFEACVAFAKFSQAAELVIGFNSVNELEAFGEAYNNARKIKPILFCTDVRVLNPLNW